MSEKVHFKPLKSLVFFISQTVSRIIKSTYFLWGFQIHFNLTHSAKWNIVRPEVVFGALWLQKFIKYDMGIRFKGLKIAEFVPDINLIVFSELGPLNRMPKN